MTLKLNAEQLFGETAGKYAVEVRNRFETLQAVRENQSPSALWKQEAQLMLTNPRDAFRGHSTSPNIVPFHRLGTVSYCEIVTLSLRGAIFTNIRLQKMSRP